MVNPAVGRGFNALQGQTTFTQTQFNNGLNAPFLQSMRVTPTDAHADTFIFANTCRHRNLNIQDPGMRPHIHMDPLGPSDLFFQLMQDQTSYACPPNLIEELNEHMNAARMDDDPAATAEIYRKALEMLELPFGPDRSEPGKLYEYVKNGDMLYAEAVLGMSLSAKTEEICSILERLYKVEDTLRIIGSNSVETEKLAQTKLLQAFLLTRYASEMTYEQVGILERVEQMLIDIETEFAHAEAGLSRDVSIYADLMKVEVLARRLEIEHHREDRKARNRAMNDLVSHIDGIVGRYDTLSEAESEFIAGYIAGATKLLARMQIWNRALHLARTITTHDQYKETEAARGILTSVEFDPFVHEAEKRILTVPEIKEHALLPGWMKRLQAAVYVAHAESVGKTAMLGVVGAAAGMAVEHFFMGGASVYGGLAGAAFTTISERLENGWTSEEAISAGQTSVFERGALETTYDVGKLLTKGSLDAFVYGVIPAAFALAAKDVGGASWSVCCNAYDLYGPKFCGWLKDSAIDLADPTTYQIAVSQLSAAIDEDSMSVVAQGLYAAYLGATGGLFVSNIFWPKSRKFAKLIAPALIPGALMLSAELGLQIAGGDYKNRVGRAAIVSAEILGVMLTWGLVSVAQRSTFKQGVRSLGKGLWNANYMLPVTAAIIQGISSALGGHMQKGDRPTDPAVISAQAAVTVAWLLPLTLLISGVLKGKIPIFERAGEGWEDSEGENPMRRVAEVVLGMASSFNMPYAHNRIGRAPTWDLTSSIPRTLLGWDTNLGQFAMSGINNICGNHATGMMWTETGGTLWERDVLETALGEALKKIKEENLELTAENLDEIKGMMRNFFKCVVAGVRDFYEKGAQNMHPAHPLLPFALRDKLFPFYAVTRAGWPPKFPLKPNGYAYANLEQMLQGRTYEKFSAEELQMLLEYVRVDARNPKNFATLLPLIKTLMLASDNSDHGEALQAFFGENPKWFNDLFGVDPERLAIGDRKYRRKIRAEVREMIRIDKKTDKKRLWLLWLKRDGREYQRNVRSDRKMRVQKVNLSAGLF